MSTSKSRYGICVAGEGMADVTSCACRLDSSPCSRITRWTACMPSEGFTAGYSLCITAVPPLPVAPVPAA
jgi:hypothetical protein